MSVVTNVMLTGLGCEGVAKRLNAWLNSGEDGDSRLGSLIQVDGEAGGTKAMETDVFLGAFNYLAVDKFIAIYRAAIALEGPQRRSGMGHVQLFLCRQDDNRFIEIPQSEDGVEYHYRTVEMDRRSS